MGEQPRRWIPAFAGMTGMDSRLRGNDGGMGARLCRNDGMRGNSQGVRGLPGAGQAMVLVHSIALHSVIPAQAHYCPE